MYVKKRALWYKLRSTPEMYKYLVDTERYKTDKAHFYIRLVYECRARLVKAQKRTMDTYQSPGFLNKCIGILENHSKVWNI